MHMFLLVCVSGMCSFTEVLSANGDEVSRLPPLQSGRSAPRRVAYDDSETRKSEGAASEDLKGRTNVTSKSSPTDVQVIKQSKSIDIHNHEVQNFPYKAR